MVCFPCWSRICWDPVCYPSCQSQNIWDTCINKSFIIQGCQSSGVTEAIESWYYASGTKPKLAQKKKLLMLNRYYLRFGFTDDTHIWVGYHRYVSVFLTYAPSDNRTHRPLFLKNILLIGIILFSTDLFLKINVLN